MADPFSSWGSGGGGGGTSRAFSDWGAGQPHYDYGSAGSGGGGGGWGLPFHVPHILGEAAGAVGNLGHDLESTAVNFFPGLYDVGKAFTKDVWAEARMRPDQAHHLEDAIAKPFASQEGYQWGPLAAGGLAAAHGNFDKAFSDWGTFRHRLYEHPLGPILDALTVVSGGAGSAARLGKAASVGRDLAAPNLYERASLAADAATGGKLSRYAEDLARPRMIRSPVDQPVEAAGGGGIWERNLAAMQSPRYRYATLAKGGTPAIRLVQRLVDRFGEAHPNAWLVGNERRIQGIGVEREIRRKKAVFTQAINPFQNAIGKLSKDDRFAFHLGLEQTDPREVFADSLHTYETVGHSWQLRRYMTRLAGKPWRTVEKILREGGDPMEGSPIVERVAQMSPELLDAIHEGKMLEEKAGNILESAGALDPVTRAARKWLAQRIRGGARVVERQNVKVTPLDVFKEQRQNLTAQRRLVTRGLAQAQRAIDEASARAARLSEIRAKRGAIPEPPDVALVRESQQRLDDAQARLQAAKDAYYTRDPHLEGAQPLDEAQAALTQAEREIVQVERELKRARATATRHVDRLGRAQEAYLKAPSGGPRREHAYNRLAHHKAEAHRVQQLSDTVHRQRNELLARRHELTLKRDAAQRAAAQIRQREEEMVAAEKEHQALLRKHGRAAAQHERRAHQHERLARLHEAAQQRASEVAQAQRELQGIDTHLAELQRGIEEDISYLNAPRPVTLTTRGGKEAPNAPQPDELRMRNDVIHQPGAIEGGPTIDELSLQRWLEVKGLEPAAVDPRAGYPGRFPHTARESGKREAGIAPGARSVTAPIEKPAMTKWNRGIRLVFARMETHPSVISRDYLRAATFKLLVDYRDYIGSKSVPLDLSKGDGLLDGHVYFYGGERITIPRFVREADPLARDKMLTDTRKTQRGVEQLSKDVVWGPGEIRANMRTLHEGGAPEGLRGRDGERLSVEELARRGVRQVPERYAKAFLRETKASSDAVHYFFDRPTDVWRALVLQYVPRWLVNNIVGQHMLYILARGSTARGYLQALATEKNVDGETWKRLWGISIAKRNFKYARMVDEIAPGAMFGAFFRSQEMGSGHLFLGDNRIGRYIDELGAAPWTKENFAGKAGVRAVGVSVGVLNGWADTMTKLNLKVADDLPRRALFLSDMQRSLAVRRVKRMAEEFEGASLSLEQAIRRVAEKDPGQIEAALERVDHALGNFTQMSHFERAYIRRFVPFYSWFKVIAKISARLPLDSPGRVRFFQLAGQVAEDDGTSFHGGPSYLEGAIVIGPESGGHQTMIATNSINPFATPIQLWQALNGGQSGTGSPVELLNPGIQAAMTGLSRHDFFYGGDYQGPGSAAPGPLVYPLSAAGYFTNLPEYRLGEQLGWYGNYQSKLYDAHAHSAGVNNYLLNYLGVPVKRVDLSEAASRKRAGQ